MPSPDGITQPINEPRNESQFMFVVPFDVERIVFDLDGTLVDSAPDLHRATNHALTSVGRPEIPLDAVRHMVGEGARRLIEKGLMHTGGINGFDLDALLPTFLDFYKDNLCIESRLYDGTLEMLDALDARGIKSAVCTNKPLHLAEPLLEALGIRQRFIAVTGGDSFPFRKPDPRHLTETLALMGGTGRAVMVGDTISDTAAARAAGIPSILVSYGYLNGNLADLDADAIVDSLVDIPGILRG